MRKIYYYINKCPRCHSPSTGYFVYDPGGDFLDDTSKEARALKSGEIQCIRHRRQTLGDPLCFCANCRIEWNERPHMRFLTKSEIEEQKRLRGISDEAIEALDEYKKKHELRDVPKPFKTVRKIVAYLTNQ